MGAERLLQSLALRLKQTIPERNDCVSYTIDAWDGMPHVFPASAGTFDAADQTLSIMATFVADKLCALAQPARRDRLRLT